MVAVRYRVVFVTDAVAQRHLWSNVPLILCVGAVLRPAQSVGIGELCLLGDRDSSAIVRKPKQHVGQCGVRVDVVRGPGGGDVKRSSGHPALELKTAARTADAAAAGGLEVIQVEVIVGEPILRGVSALGPT